MRNLFDAGSSQVYKRGLPCQLNRGNDLEDRWRSVDEIAEYLGVSKDTVYAWVTQKGMPGHKVGRFWKFKREDVDAWIRDGGAASRSDEDLKEKSDDE
ncbi:MAG: helix-turn-helix domain-containing protein [Thiocapsa sp.]|nr:MAG: helix-turn-helix domain-containing protein [Thiocapsa sp.]